MYLITLKIQEARSKLHPDKPGKVYLSIVEREPMSDGTVRSQRRSVNIGVSVQKGARFRDLREELLPYVYNTYLIIDKLRNSGSPFSIDDVSERLKSVIANDRLDTRIAEDFIWDTDVTTLKKDLIPFFKYKKVGSKYAVSEDTDMKPESLPELFSLLSRKMLSEGRESTSDSYKSTANSQKRFLGDEDVSLTDINHNFIEDYAGWLKDNGVADSTQSFYLRTLRAGISHAVKEGIAVFDKDMFRNVNTKVSLDTVGNENACLSRETLLKIANLDLSKSENLDLARDMFMFGFYCRGMELTDIMALTTGNLNGDVLKYRRRGNGKEITLRLDSRALAILKKYESRHWDSLFPLKTSPLIKLDRALKYRVSNWLGKIGEMVGLRSLSFNMNISSCNHLLARADLPGVLLGL